jgi:hypothetical protein
MYEPTAAGEGTATLAECHCQFRTYTVDANNAVLEGLNSTTKKLRKHIGE